MYSLTTWRSWNWRDNASMSRVVLGDHDHAGRSAIQPVHDSRPFHAADSGQAAQVMQQRVDESSRRVSRAGMYDQARRLVDRGQVSVLVENRQRNRPRPRAVRPTTFGTATSTTSPSQTASAGFGRPSDSVT